MFDVERGTLLRAIVAQGIIDLEIEKERIEMPIQGRIVVRSSRCKISVQIVMGFLGYYLSQLGCI